jgi:hypothetical protein
MSLKHLVHKRVLRSYLERRDVFFDVEGAVRHEDNAGLRDAILALRYV